MSADALFSIAAIDPTKKADADNLAGTIQRASSATGTSFEYLLAAGKIESNLNPNARASTSSARGLYQFIEQTWLGTVKEAGAAFGYSNYAEAITKTSSGRYQVNDPAMRDAILKLRDDPAANAAMAGVLTQSNSFKLTGALGRRPTDGELYIAHFLGSGGASKLIAQAETNPNASAASAFPAAAAANRSIFYERTSGRARSVSEVYGVLTGKYTRAANTTTVQQALAAAGQGSGAASSRHTASGIAAIEKASGARGAAHGAPSQAMAFAADPAGRADAARVDTGRAFNILPPAMRTSALGDDGKGFHSLFRAGERNQAVSPAIEKIWAAKQAENGAVYGTGGTSAGTATHGTATAQSATQVSAAAAPQEPRLAKPQPGDLMPLDLFSDRAGRFAQT